MSDDCLDEGGRALNDKIKLYQEKQERHTAGLRDSAAEQKARAEIMRQSAALNLRTAEHCEQLSKKCLDTCGASDGTDAKSAVAQCTQHAAIVRSMRDQAAREDNQAKRAARALK